MLLFKSSFLNTFPFIKYQSTIRGCNKQAYSGQTSVIWSLSESEQICLNKIVYAHSCYPRTYKIVSIVRGNPVTDQADIMAGRPEHAYASPSLLRNTVSLHNARVMFPSHFSVVTASLCCSLPLKHV